MKIPTTSCKKGLIILMLSGLWAMNYSIVITVLDSNFLGVFFSVVLFLTAGRKTTLKMGYPLVGMIIILEFISYRLHTKTLHFQALSLFICLIYYSFTRKFSFIAFISLFLFSSVFDQLFNYLTVEIKQILCYNVYLTLRNFIEIERIEGVNFYINNSKISVDTACMGLSMFKTGLLIGAFLLTLEEHKQQKFFSIIQILLFCLMVVVLNIISNYFRIITLLLFNCTEDNVAHHAIGIVCLVFYQILPMLVLIRLFKPKKEEIIEKYISFKLLPIIITIVILLTTSLEIKKEQSQNILEDLNPKYNLQKGSWINKEVFKISTSNKLIYIKTPAHKPLICWTGNGYKIIESKKIIQNSEEIWLAKIEKGNVRYFSYWWYECGNKKYTSLIDVLLIKLFYNKPVRLINETSRIEIR